MTGSDQQQVGEIKEKSMKYTKRILNKRIAKKMTAEQKQASERKIKYFEVFINFLMLLVVGYYTFCAHRQVEEAKKSNDLNQKVAYANFSSTKKSLEMTQDSLKATKDSLAKLTENVTILKNTQKSIIVSHYMKIEKIDFKHNIPTHFFINLTNVGTVSATINPGSYVCASIAKLEPADLDCQRLSKLAKSTDYDFSLGPKDEKYGVKTQLVDEISDETKTKMKEGKLRLYVKGQIPYSDYLASRRFSFCYKWKYTDESLRSEVPTIPMSFEGEWETCQ